MGAFSLKISIAPSGETIAQIKKNLGGGYKNGTHLLYHHASMVGIVGRAPAVDEKVWCFFVCLFVTLWNYEVCDNGNTMKQWNFQNNYGTVAQRKVSSCAPIFKFLYRPPRFFLRGKFIPKIANWAILAAVRPHF